MEIVCTTHSAHYTGLAWSTPVVASFPGDIDQLFIAFCSHVGEPGNEATTAAQVLFRLDKVKQSSRSRTTVRK